MTDDSEIKEREQRRHEYFREHRWDFIIQQLDRGELPARDEVLRQLRSLLVGSLRPVVPIILLVR